MLEKGSADLKGFVVLYAGNAICALGLYEGAKVNLVGDLRNNQYGIRIVSLFVDLTAENLAIAENTTTRHLYAGLMSWHLQELHDRRQLLRLHRGTHDRIGQLYRSIHQPCRSNHRQCHLPPLPLL